jgi:hypothetical protein
MQPSRKLIIGLVGLKWSGKDTLFKIIKEEFPEAFRVAFADAVKEELAQALGITVEEIEADKERFRLGLQWWGTEWRRHNTPNYWIYQAFRKIREADTGLVVVTDVRFPDEGDAIRGSGGFLVKVERPGLSVPADPHASEKYAITMVPDWTVQNPGEPVEIYRAAAGRLLDHIHTLRAMRAA